MYLYDKGQQKPMPPTLTQMYIIFLGAGELHFGGPPKKSTKVLSLSHMEVRLFLFFIQKPKCLLVRPGESGMISSTTGDLRKGGSICSTTVCICCTGAAMCCNKVLYIVHRN